MEFDDQRRADLVREAMRVHRDDIGYIPLHQQLAWGVRQGVKAHQRPDNALVFKWISSDRN
jgi:peptide/nickel transport system substrate-binding protein